MRILKHFCMFQNGVNAWHRATFSVEDSVAGKVYFYKGDFIESITPGNPAEIVFKGPHEFVNGDSVTIDRVVGGTAGVNGVHTVTVIDAVTISIPLEVIDAGVRGAGGVLMQSWVSTTNLDGILVGKFGIGEDEDNIG